MSPDQLGDLLEGAVARQQRLGAECLERISQGGESLAWILGQHAVDGLGQLHWTVGPAFHQGRHRIVNLGVDHAQGGPIEWSRSATIS